MANNDSNTIKPVEGLQNIAGLTPTRRREQRKHQQSLPEENEENPESAKGEPDEQNPSDEPAENENDQHPDSTGVDYCA